MDARTIVFLLVAINLGSGQVVLGQAASNADGKTWWNPMTWTMGSNEANRTSSSFGMSEKKPASATTFSTPKLPWVSGDSSTTVKSDFSKSLDSAKKSSTSTLSRMGQSTKKAWNSTVDFLNPFDSGSKPAKQQQGYQPQNVQSKPGGGMFGWMWREERVESPSTVNEFLRQERPRF